MVVLDGDRAAVLESGASAFPSLPPGEQAANMTATIAMARFPTGPIYAARGNPWVAARAQGSSDAYEPVRFLDETGDVRWAHPLATEHPEVLVSRPTGDGASLSDVDRYVVLPGFSEKVPDRRDANALEAFADIDLQELGRVTGED